MVAVSNPSAVAREQAMDHLGSMDRERDRAFANAAFSVFGLDPRWTDLRSFGGWGKSNGITNHLSLSFGDPSDEHAPIVQIETRAPRAIGRDRDPDPFVDRYHAASDLVRHLARMTGALAPEVRAAAFPYQDPDAYGKDPTAPWDDATIGVDDIPLPAKVLSGDETTWVALIQVDDLFVAIQSEAVPLDAVGLVEVTDFDVYAEGSAEIRARMTRRRNPRPAP
jgi:hypothetical protein